MKHTHKSPPEAPSPRNAPYSTLTMNFLHLFFKGMFRFTFKRLLFSILAAVTAFAVHWFFLVIVNNGFNMERGNWYNNFLVFGSREYPDFFDVTRRISSLLALPMVLSVLLTPISRFSQLGFRKTVRGWLQEVPRALKYATGRYDSARTIRYYVGVLLGTGLALAFQNPIFGIAMAISLFFSGSYGMTGTGVALLYCIHSDMTPAAKKKTRLFVADNPCAVLDGMALGWLAASIPLLLSGTRFFRRVDCPCHPAFTIAHLGCHQAVEKSSYRSRKGHALCARVSVRHHLAACAGG